MRKILYTLLLGFSGVLSAQITYKSEYIGTSAFRKQTGDEKSVSVGNSKGYALVQQAGINLPFSYRLDENDRPILWGFSVGYAYASLHNENFTEDLVADDLTNAVIGIYHLRPINTHWSYLATVGVGAFVAGADFGELRSNDVLGQVGVLFIRHLKPGLDLGGGIAFNNSFGYPMAFPTFYLKWQTDGRYTADVSLMQGFQASISYQMKEWLKLSYVLEADGQLAFELRNDREEMFTHQYLTTGLRSVFQIGKKLELPITAGISTLRSAEYTDRKLTTMFQSNQSMYYFRVAPYVSAGISYNLF